MKDSRVFEPNDVFNFTMEEFENWLKDQPEDAQYTASSCTECPLAAYLGDRGLLDPRVYSAYVHSGINNLWWSEDWPEDFIRKVDLLGRINADDPISPSQCLEILKELEDV